jgi:hypothetical protein
MTFVIGRLAAAGCAEWLAGARACPNRSVIWPAGKPEGEGPSADPGEEVALTIGPQVVRSNIGN